MYLHVDLDLGTGTKFTIAVLIFRLALSNGHWTIPQFQKVHKVIIGILDTESLDTFRSTTVEPLAFAS